MSGEFHSMESAHPANCRLLPPLLNLLFVSLYIRRALELYSELVVLFRLYSPIILKWSFWPLYTSYLLAAVVLKFCCFRVFTLLYCFPPMCRSSWRWQFCNLTSISSVASFSYWSFIMFCCLGYKAMHHFFSVSFRKSVCLQSVWDTAFC